MATRLARFAPELCGFETLETTQMQLLTAFAGQVAGALERCALVVQAERVRLEIETERLRNSLLSTVSHDLRTPMATITGAAGLLVRTSTTS